MDELLQKIEADTGVPVDMVLRSAEARAAADGVPTEDILAAWAGEAAPAAAPAAAEAPPPPSPDVATPSPEPGTSAPPTGTEEAVDEGSPGVEILEPVAAEPGESAPEAIEEPVPEPVAAAPVFPRWLAAAFVVLPLIAVMYAIILPSGPECGASGQLEVDPATGLAVNCDGTPFGAAMASFFAIGETVFEERCVACHSADGSGGVGPAFVGGAILTTFPQDQCSDHVTWVELGSSGWPEATYGANQKPVGGSGAAMPGFGGVLTPEELQAVALYERVQFGEQPLAEAEADCGLVEGEVVAAP